MGTADTERKKTKLDSVMLDQNWRYLYEVIGNQYVCRKLWNMDVSAYMYACTYIVIYIYSLALSPERAWEQ